MEEVVRKKYHILKTSDNFYIYKMDIKKCLREMRENDEWIESVRARAKAAGDEKEDVLEILDQIERGLMILNTGLPIWIKSIQNTCVPR